MKTLVTAFVSLVGFVCGAADNLPEFKVIGHVTEDFRFQSELTYELKT
jgi:hypothetical protein